MRAARLHELGASPVVDEIDAPEGDDVVQVSASALNPVDIAIGSGRFYGWSPEVPYVIGSEAVGTTADGRRVWSYARSAMAERFAPAAASLVELADGIDDTTALACGIAGLTAWLAISWRAPVTSDDTVLVLGASGTLGSVAVQGAKLLGAGRVVGAARRVDAIPSAADEVVDLPTGGTFPAATLIVDALYGEPFERAFEAAGHGVRVVQLGQSAGPEATLKSNWIRGKAATIFGHALGGAPQAVRDEGHRTLCAHVLEGRISIPTESYPLDDVAAAWERQASGSPGAKIVVTL